MYKKLKDRNEAILEARSLMQRSDWLIWDTETTGLNQNDEIIQIGIIDPHGNIVFESLVNPVKRRISQEAKDVHGIDLRMLKDSPTFKEILPKLREILNGKLVVAYNAEFERRMFIQTCAKHFKKIERDEDIKFNMDCAMVGYSRYIGEWSDYHKDYKFQKLPGSTHNALGDCYAILKLIKEMANAELSIIPDPWWKNLLNYFRRKK